MAYTPNFTGAPKKGTCAAPLSGTAAAPNNLQEHYVLTFILPYMEQQPLYDKINFEIDWFTGGPNKPADQQNLSAVQVEIPDYLCPSAPSRSGKFAADYITLVDIIEFPGGNFSAGYCDLETANLTPQKRPLDKLEGMLNDYPIPVRRVSDGLSKTFLFFECAGRPTAYEKGKPPVEDAAGMHFQWADDSAYGTWNPETECGLSTTMNCTNWDDIWSFHSGGATFLFGDGSVDFLTEDLHVDTFVSLFTRAADDLTGNR
jgi:prepilin-type processing-associated H-X9-DG protein